MIKISNVVDYGWEAAIRGMRNPLNSWDKSDSYYDDKLNAYVVNSNDIALMKKLAAAGSDHAKFLCMITVTADITAPLYWWKEFDTYKVGTVANSCSTMHKIHAKEFELDDFSCEHLLSAAGDKVHWGDYIPKETFLTTIMTLNENRERFIETGDKVYWWQMIQLLPSSYNQLRTVQLNYQVLKNMYHARKEHKLDEWREFCKWIETLPLYQLITGRANDAEE